jgi:predicted PurR-regulated permease PerM
MQEVRAPTQSDRREQRLALGILTGLAFVVVAWMAAPLLVGLALGTVMGFTAQPLHDRLMARLHGRRTLASAIATFLGGILMAGGGAAGVWIVARKLVEVVQLYQHQWLGGAPVPLGPRMTRLLTALGVSQEVIVARLRDQLGRLANLVAQGAGLIVQASAGVVLTIVVALWTMYYVLVDWPRIERHLERLLPLDPSHTRALVAEFRQVGQSAFVGTVLSAVVQGATAGVGFTLFGVPQPITWAAVLAVTSFIPVIGTLLVWVPAAVWLLTTGHLVRALLLTAWSLLFVMAANDYVIRPRLVGRGGAHPLLMLIALIGGISVFGVAGVIVGPVIMSIFLASARIFERERERQPEGAA